MSLEDYVSQGLFDPKRIASALLTSLDELARSAGLSENDIQRIGRIRHPRIQRRLRELVEVLNKVEERCGSPPVAYAWFRSQVLPGFSGHTAMQLVQADQGGDVLEYLDSVDAGIHA